MGKAAKKLKTPETVTVLETRARIASAEQTLISTPPVILNGDDEDSQKQVADYINMHKTRGAIVAAKEESARLTPYFEAWGKRLQDGLNSAASGPVIQLSRYQHPEIATAELVKPGNLAKMFTAMAAYNRATILSGVMLIPTAPRKDDHILKPYLAAGSTEFSKPSYYNGQKIDFGFIQVFHNESDENTCSSISLPVMGLDSKLLGIIEPHGGAELLRHLQTAITWANHDMLHHFTADVINPLVVKNANAGQQPILNWKASRIPGFGDRVPHGYEGWANTSQAKTWRYLPETGAGTEFRNSVKSFLGKLEDIANALKKDSRLTDDEKHQAIDYFGTIMGFSMARVLPLDSPVIGEYLQGLEKIDPAPQKIFEEEKKSSAIASYKITSSFSNKEILQAVDHVLTMANELPRTNTLLTTAENIFPNTAMFTDLENDYVSSIKKKFSRSRKKDNKTFLKALEAALEYDTKKTVAGYLKADFDYLARNLKAEEMPEAEAMLENIRTFFASDSIVKDAGTEALASMQELDDYNVGEKKSFYGFDNPADDYITLKKIQIAKMIPSLVYIHVDANQGVRLKMTQDTIDDTDIAMLKAVAEVTWFNPSG